ncbi:NADP-dependent oxidoreductase [Lentzea sp. NEAU-D13]|uniref:NADP-dependent oxidoreductase n=1 Tax=Lentzea alba TaxID=2714351 RepID=A0A7C9VNU4_9PSEU|nr:NADP-dependent oxidoreductase [Lentzea alba]NGY58535.1 NADP-dependent oxidoreductase [Lentzea alba]
MKIARIHEFGGPDVIRLDDVPLPVPGPAEVLVRVAATSFNPTEGWLRRGMVPMPVTLPFAFGWDVAGTVVESGEQVVGFLDGGAAAEFVAAPRERLVSAPRNVPLHHAAALPLAGLTAWQAVAQARLRPGERVLVNGAGGGIGGIVVQLAKRAGAHVIATASPRSAAAVRAFGADEVVDYTLAPLPQDADVVLNLVGTADVPAGARTVSITTKVGTHVVTRYDRTELAELVALVESGELALDVTEVLPLDAIAEVHGRGEVGDIRGKIVLTP